MTGQMPSANCEMLSFWLEFLCCHLTRHQRPLTISDISLSIKHLVVFPQTADGSRP